MPTEEVPDFKERKLADLDKAKSLFNKLWTNGEGRRISWSRILNQLNGGKPFNDDDLARSGQSWRTNINFRDASSTLEQVLVAYWRMVHDTTNLAVVEVDSEDRNKDQWEQLFQSGFDKFHEAWGPGHVRNYLQMSMHHVGFGVGVGLFEDDKSPRYSAVRMDDILVPDRTPADVDKFGTVVLRQELPISELYDKIRNESTASARGWNPKAVRETLWCAINSQPQVQNDDYLKVEDQLRDNSAYYDEVSETVPVVHILTKEWDGRITRVTFPNPDSINCSEYLFDDYDVPSRPTSYREILFSIFFEAGDGLFYGSKGFGQKNYGIALTLNRLKSRAVDRTLIDGLNFRDLSDGARDTIPITNIGPFNILPRDLEQVPQYPTGRTILETIGMIESTQAYNNARFRDQSQQIAQTDTATQANILASLQSQVDVANATLYLTQVARNIFAEQFRRLRKRGSDDPDAQAFYKHCVIKGKMPEEVFYDAEISVRTGADPGTASAALRAQIARELMTLSAGNRHIDDRAATEGYVTNTLGASAVRKYLRPVGEEEDPDAVRTAVLENAAFGDGLPVPVPPKDPHETHVPYHVQPMKAIVDAFRQTGQLQPESLIALQNGIPHVEQHMEFLKGDELRKAAYQKYRPIVAEITAQANRMFAMAQRLQEQQAQAAGASPAGPAPVAAGAL